MFTSICCIFTVSHLNIINLKNHNFIFSLSLTLTLTDDLGKPGSDAGMPGIEDSEVGKVDEMQFGEY